MLRFLLVLLIPLFINASEISNIYRIGSASVKVNGDNYVDGVLVGYKLHINDGSITMAADLNYIIVDDNNYEVDDTLEAMGHLGTMATDALELYGSLGLAYESENSGLGWGFGLVYHFTDSFAFTYEYRLFDMDEYDLKSASIGILIGF